MEIDRKLASIRQIRDLQPIKGADNIECATVDGWKVVVRKGEFFVGELVVYLEIDSWVPTAVAPFLQRGHATKMFKGVEGNRLRTVKLRGQVSQGLILSLSPYNVRIDDDMTEKLGILQWEPEQAAPGMQGEPKGNFPHFLVKTDQPRIQNVWDDVRHTIGLFEVTEKLDGSSMTVYYRNAFRPVEQPPEFGVCSRNVDLKETDGNAFWDMANFYGLREKMFNLDRNLAIQGELIGPGIQGNPYKLSKRCFCVYDIWDINRQQYMPATERDRLTRELELPHVPMYGARSLTRLDTTTGVYRQAVELEELLSQANGPSYVGLGAIREGIVFKSIENPFVSFKVISNEFLLKDK